MSDPYEQIRQQLQAADASLESAPTAKLKRELGELSTARIREILGQLATEYGVLHDTLEEATAVARRTDEGAERVYSAYKQTTQGTDNINALDAQAHLTFTLSFLASTSDRLSIIVNHRTTENPLDTIKLAMKYSTERCDAFDQGVQRATTLADETAQGVAETRNLAGRYRDGAL